MPNMPRHGVSPNSTLASSPFWPSSHHAQCLHHVSLMDKDPLTVYELCIKVRQAHLRSISVHMARSVGDPISCLFTTPASGKPCSRPTCISGVGTRRNEHCTGSVTDLDDHCTALYPRLFPTPTAVPPDHPLCLKPVKHPCGVPASSTFLELRQDD